MRNTHPEEWKIAQEERKQSGKFKCQHQGCFQTFASKQKMQNHFVKHSIPNAPFQGTQTQATIKAASRALEVEIQTDWSFSPSSEVTFTASTDASNMAAKIEDADQQMAPNQIEDLLGPQIFTTKHIIYPRSISRRKILLEMKKEPQKTIKKLIKKNPLQQLDEWTAPSLKAKLSKLVLKKKLQIRKNSRKFQLQQQQATQQRRLRLSQASQRAFKNRKVSFFGKKPSHHETSMPEEKKLEISPFGHLELANPLPAWATFTIGCLRPPIEPSDPCTRLTVRQELDQLIVSQKAGRHYWKDFDRRLGYESQIEALDENYTTRAKVPPRTKPPQVKYPLSIKRCLQLWTALCSCKNATTAAKKLISLDFPGLFMRTKCLEYINSQKVVLKQLRRRFLKALFQDVNHSELYTIDLATYLPVEVSNQFSTKALTFNVPKPKKKADQLKDIDQRYQEFVSLVNAFRSDMRWMQFALTCDGSQRVSLDDLFVAAMMKTDTLQEAIQWYIDCSCKIISAVKSQILPYCLLAESIYSDKAKLPIFRCCEEHCSEAKALLAKEKYFAQATFIAKLGNSLQQEASYKLNSNVLLLFYDDSNHELILLE